jgi:hypothetical protein
MVIDARSVENLETVALELAYWMFKRVITTPITLFE